VKRILHLGGYGAWFLAAFVFGVYLTFPLDDVKPLLIGMLEDQLGKGKQGAHGVDPKIEVGSLRLSGFGVRADRVMVQLPSRDPDPGPTIDLDSVAVGVAPFSLLGKAKTVTFDADLYGGDVNGAVSVDDKGTVHDLDLSIDDVDLSKIILVQAKLGIPIGGKLSLDADLELGPTAEKDGNGEVKIDLQGASIGPGNLKLAAAFGGFELPAVDLGRLSGEIPIEKGKGSLTNVKLDGKDVQAELLGDINVKGRVQLSRVDVDGWFALTPSFLEREKKFQSLLELGESMGGMGGGPSLSRAKDEDGHYWFGLKGPIQGPPSATLARDAGKRAKAKAAKGTAAPATAPKKEAPEKPESEG
jgi:type II secretion system protein N